jgi:hypothetical protein
MKASELKPGDHYTYPRFNGRGPHYRLEEGGSAICVKAGIFPGDLVLVPVGWRFNNTPGGNEVELVPMPAPYVIGKAYRMRNGGKLVYTGPNTALNSHTHPHGFKSPARTFQPTVRPGGEWAKDGEPTDFDIMGEWREETAAIPGSGSYTLRPSNLDNITQCPAAKEIPVKRTLPTVTLDQIFETLVSQGACWAKDGPIALVHKLNSIIPSKGTAPLTFRGLVHCVQRSQTLSSSDAAWLCRAMGEKLLPQGLKDQMGSQMTFESPKLLVAIAEWENPKPKALEWSDLPVGTRFRMAGEEYLVVGWQDNTASKKPSTGADFLKLSTSCLAGFGTDHPRTRPAEMGIQITFHPDQKA